jgi:hypothetical protein
VGEERKVTAVNRSVGIRRCQGTQGAANDRTQSEKTHDYLSVYDGMNVDLYACRVNSNRMRDFARRISQKEWQSTIPFIFLEEKR